MRVFAEVSSFDRARIGKFENSTNTRIYRRKTLASQARVGWECGPALREGQHDSGESAIVYITQETSTKATCTRVVHVEAGLNISLANHLRERLVFTREKVVSSSKANRAILSVAASKFLAAMAQRFQPSGKFSE